MYDEIYGEFKEHVKPGDKVWWAGDMIDYPQLITVGPSHNSEEWRNGQYRRGHCYEEVNSFWNKLYFSNQKDAEHHNWQYRGGFYESFQRP